MRRLLLQWLPVVLLVATPMLWIAKGSGVVDWPWAVVFAPWLGLFALGFLLCYLIANTKG